MDEEVLVAAEEEAALPIAANPSAGLEDHRFWIPSDDSDDNSTEASDGKSTSSISDSIESSNNSGNNSEDIDSIRQKAVEEYRLELEREYSRVQADAQRRIDEEAEEARLAEEENLLERANYGDLEAQEILYQRALEETSRKVESRKTKAALEPERAAARNEIRRQLWEEYSKSFGVEPDDKEILDLPAEAGMRGINAALIRRTSDSAIIEAAKQNPAMQKWIKEEVEKASKAAGARAMARALGSEESPRADAAGATGGKAMTSDELDRALMQNPDDPELYKLWVKRERSAGRHW
jgi:hypothetical protein